MGVGRTYSTCGLKKKNIADAIQRRTWAKGTGVQAAARCPIALACGCAGKKRSVSCQQKEETPKSALRDEGASIALRVKPDVKEERKDRQISSREIIEQWKK